MNLSYKVAIACHYRNNSQEMWTMQEADSYYRYLRLPLSPVSYFVAIFLSVTRIVLKIIHFTEILQNIYIIVCYELNTMRKSINEPGIIPGMRRN